MSKETNKYEYWELLRRLKQEYDNQYTGYYEPTFNGYSDSFDNYVREQYGIKVVFNDGYITQDVEILDEAKYAWCILKHK